MTCPCGSNLNYANCCKISHNNPSFIKTAELLMRSRYTAFTMHNGDYLINTHHSSTRFKVNKLELENWSKSVTWIKLEVLETKMGGENDNEGTVYFKAHFIEKGEKQYIEENSLFNKEFGEWKYVGYA
jgi:SEC-C motif-containing protein